MESGPNGDIISEIAERMSSLRVFCDDGNSTSITENIKQHLLTIKGVVQKLEQDDSTTWLGQVTDVVTDLFDLLDYLHLPADAALPQKQSKIRSFLSLCNLRPRAPQLRLEQMEKRLQQVAADSTKWSLKDAEDSKLPSWHLKQCFAYSSLIFSTSSSVDAQMLIRLWMAEGFLGPIKSSSPREPEDWGLDCIQEFHRKLIFSVTKNEDGIVASCSMRRSAKAESERMAGDDSLSMDDPEKEVKERVRRVSLTSDLDVSDGIPKSLFKTNKNLLTFILPVKSIGMVSRVPYELKLGWSACDAIFSAFKRLRVLTLSDLGMKMLPGSIAELKSLRYLDLSKNNMEKLPYSVGELRHLQTLILSHCHQLRELPSDVNHFVSLRHLELDECLDLTHMPPALKKLTWLRTLSHFVASTNRTGGLGELINLNNVRGELEISHLDRLKHKESDQGGHDYLKKKEHLKSLTLRWNHHDQDDADGEQHKMSLMYLEPHPNLQRLCIIGYEGKKISDWLSSIKNLVVFILYDCYTCKSLPPLDQLPGLKTLQLERLDSLEFITDQDDGCNEPGSPATTKLFFPSLKQLKMLDCPNLTSWWKGRTCVNAKPSSFPSISTLRLQYCPKLDCMPFYPNLDKELVLECSRVKPLLETIYYRTDTGSSAPLSKLKKLTIANLEEQSPLPDDWLKNFTSLHALILNKCKGLKSLMKGFKHLDSLRSLEIVNCTELDLPDDEWKGLKNLVGLYIADIPMLNSTPDGIKHLTSLFSLQINSCPELTTLSEGIGRLKSLRILRIEECHNLASLPQLPQEMGNGSLSFLRIRSCPLLLPRCQEGIGVDWPHIRHVRFIDVKDL